MVSDSGGLLGVDGSLNGDLRHTYAIKGEIQ
jgi:hypothetical protein